MGDGLYILLTYVQQVLTVFMLIWTAAFGYWELTAGLYGWAAFEAVCFCANLFLFAALVYLRRRLKDLKLQRWLAETLRDHT
jgi:hypothetical protein